jgi:hypothetical protein
MLLGRPLFDIPNDIMKRNDLESEISQLKRIFSICGALPHPSPGEHAL